MVKNELKNKNYLKRKLKFTLSKASKIKGLREPPFQNAIYLS